MSQPKVSVLMPCYNGARYIQQAIKSILDQDMTDWELIIVDDGSTDDSRAIIDSFRDDRIHCITNPTNLGVVASRNAATKKAKGKYLSIMDTDDVARPDKLSRQVDFLEKNQDFALVGSWARLIDDRGRDTGKYWKLKSEPDKIKAELIFRNYFVHSAILVHREIALKFPYENGLEIGEDYKFIWDVSRESKVANLNELLISYRLHDANITRKKELHRKCLIEMYQRMFDEIGLETDTEELELHLDLRGSLEDIRRYPPKAIAAWLNRIREINDRSGLVDRTALDRVIRSRWMKVCNAHWKDPLSIIRESYKILNHG